MSADELYKIDKTAMGEVLHVNGNSSHPALSEDHEDTESSSQPDDLLQEDSKVTKELDDSVKICSDSDESAKVDEDIDKDVKIGTEMKCYCKYFMYIFLLLFLFCFSGCSLCTLYQ